MYTVFLVATASLNLILYILNRKNVINALVAVMNILTIFYMYIVNGGIMR